MLRSGPGDFAPFEEPVYGHDLLQKFSANTLCYRFVVCCYTLVSVYILSFFRAPVESFSELRAAVILFLSKSFLVGLYSEPAGC